MDVVVSTVAEVVPFRDLCRMLEQVSAAWKADQRKSIMGAFMKQWRIAHSKLHHNDKNTAKLAEAIIRVLTLSPKSEDAQYIKHYKAPANKSNIGDFAATASKVLKLRLKRDQSDIKIAEVNRLLDTIALANANGEREEIDNALRTLLREMNEVEAKWLIRILLKQMKIGMQDSTVLAVFHPEAGQLYDVTSSLQKVCVQLNDPNTRLDVIQIQLFNPFRPMLANRLPPEKVCDVMLNRPFFVESKYDGERVQLHKDGAKYKYFSRNGNDLTNSYGADPLTGSLTPNIHHLFAPHVQRCIVDAEMVGWNPAAKCIATKGEQFDVKSLKPGDDLSPCLVAFDCLLLNDDVLTMKPLRERVDVLESMFTSQSEGRFMLAKRQVKETVEEVVECLNDAIDRHEEGLVVKRPDSTYRLNTRSNEAGWIKLKPDYIDSINDDFDLAIVGGYFGDGTRANLLSHFLLALVDTKGQDGEAHYTTVCKVGSGYSMKELYDLNVHLNKCPLIRPKQKGHVPEWLKCGTERAQVYIHPKNSKTLQIRAAEITPSNSYGIGFTFRFPRVIKVRDDKNAEDCMAVDQFEALRLECDGKLASRKRLAFDASGVDELSPTKKRRRGGRAAIVPVLGTDFQTANVRGLQVKTNVFQGKEVCVLSGTKDDSRTKQDLEKIVHQLGGKIVANAGSKTYCVVAGRVGIKVKNLIDAGTHNVVSADWLLRCDQQGTLVPWIPMDMLHTLPGAEKDFRGNFDKYGDSYTEPITAEQLKALFAQIPAEATSTTLLHEIDPQYQYALFRPCRIYVDRFVELEDKSSAIPLTDLRVVELRSKLYGAIAVEKLENCTHAIMDQSDTSRLPTITAINRKLPRKFRIVSDQWVSDSIADGVLKPEENYPVVAIT